MKSRILAWRLSSQQPPQYYGFRIDKPRWRLTRRIVKILRKWKNEPRGYGIGKEAKGEGIEGREGKDERGKKKKTCQIQKYLAFEQSKGRKTRRGGKGRKTRGRGTRAWQAYIHIAREDEENKRGTMLGLVTSGKEWIQGEIIYTKEEGNGGRKKPTVWISILGFTENDKIQCLFSSGGNARIKGEIHPRKRRKNKLTGRFISTLVLIRNIGYNAASCQVWRKNYIPGRGDGRRRRLTRVWISSLGVGRET